MNFQPKTTLELIDAINYANGHNTQTYTIELMAGREYALPQIAGAYNTDLNGASGLPIITSTITVIGNGATIRRTSTELFRIFHVASTGKLTLRGLTLQDGKLVGLPNANGLHGACIRNAGQLTIFQCKLLYNMNDLNAGYGGAIYSALGGILTIQDSLVFGNEASHAAVASDGILSISGTVISANKKGNNVGAVGGSGRGVITRCTIASNIAQDAGALRWGGINPIGGPITHQLTVTYCDILLNRANNSGACLFIEPASNAVVKLNYNRIFDNYSFDTSNLNRDVYYAPTDTGLPNLDATNNWWGADNGPSGAGPGVGDSITTRINYSPFRNTEVPAHEGNDTCPINYAGNDGYSSFNPISLRLGEKRLEVTDFSLQTPAGSLNFTHAYRQFKQTDDPYTFFRLMGLGWTHNHNFRLVDETTNTPPRIVVLSPNGGTVVFSIPLSTTQYLAAEGSSSQIKIDNASTSARYVMTASDKSTYEFDSNKKLRKITFPNKEYWLYRYFGDDAGETTHFAKGELKEVVDDGYLIDTTTKRKLQLVYIQNPTFLNSGTPTPYAHSYLLWRVGDHTATNLTSGNPTGRYIELAYMPERNDGVLVTNPKALLASVTDVREKTRLWKYGYYGQSSGENNASQLNWMTQRETPSVDTDGDNIANAILKPESLTYGTHNIDLAINGSMDSDSDWTNVGALGIGANIQASNPTDGFYRQVSVDASGKGIEGRVWRLTKGRPYIISARVRINTTGRQVTMRTTNNLSTGSPAFSQTSNVNIIGSWQTLTVNHNPSESADYRLQFVADGSCVFHVDDVTIIETNLSITQKRGFTGTDPTPLLDTTFKFAPALNYSTETIANLATTHQFQWGVYAGYKDAASNTVQQIPDIQFRTISQKDPNGNSTGLTWSNDGKFLIGVTDAGGNQTSFAYNVAGPAVDTLKESIDAAGRRTVYAYEDATNAPRLPTLVLATDGRDLAVNGDMELDSNWGSVGSPSTNAQSNLQVASGSYSRRVVATAAGQGIQGDTWDLVAGRNYLILARVYPASGTVRMKVSGTTAFDKTATGTGWKTLRATFTPTATSTGVRLQFLADGGAAEFFVDSVYILDNTIIQHWQEFTYDPKGRTLNEKQINPANGTTILQQTIREYYTSGSGNGLLKKVTQDSISGSDDVTTEYQYDTAGRVTQIKQIKLAGDCCGTLTQYDAAGNVTQTTNVRDWLAQSDPIKCPVTTYAYDEIGRRVRTTINVGTAAAQTALTFYDALNRVVRTITNYFNQSGGAAETPGAWVWSSANNRWEKGVGNTTAISHGTDNTQNIISDTQYNARGMVKLQRDTLGNITLFGYDDAGRLVKTIQNASIQSALFVPYNNDYVAVSGAPNATPDPDLSEYGTVTFPYSTNPDQDIFSLQTYDTVGNLVKTQDVLGTVNYTVYDALNRPIKTVRAAKSTATISVNPFNADGTPNPSYDAANDPRSSSYVPSTLLDRDIIESTIYDALGRVVQQIDVNGRISLTVYDLLGRASRTISNYVVQLDGSSQPTDPQNWYWDAAANPKQWKQSSIVSALAISHGAKDDQNIITWTNYDPAGQVMWTQDILGRRTWTKYDELGRVVKTIGNAVGTAEDGLAGDPRSTSYVPSTNSDKDRITITTYDGNGRVMWTQDPNGRKNWNVYDSLGRIKKTIANCTFVSGTPAPESDSYVGSSNADDDIITRTTYNDAGQVYQTYDALNRETRHFYDILGRRIKTVTNYVDGIYDPLQPDRDLIQTTEYDRAGRVIKTTDARGTQTTFSYDRAGRRLTIAQAANTLLATTSYTCYDKAGRVQRTIANWRNTPGQPSPDAKDISNNWLFNPATHGADNDCDLITIFDYDTLGRRLKVTDPIGNFSQTVYFKDGTVDTVIDPENVTSKFRYDQLRRRFRVVQSYVVQGTSDPVNWVWESTAWKQAAGGTGIVHGPNQDQNIIVDVVYDRAGRITSQREPRGNVTLYEYDQLDRRTKLKNPVLTEWNSAYTDVAGGKTRATITYPGLSTGGSYPVQREFDRAGRLASIVYGSPTSTPDVQMTYDKAGNRLKMSEYAGANFTSRNRETSFGYDQARRLTSVGFDNDGNGTVDETVSYEYDAGGQRTKLTMPGSLSITYTYDSKGQLCSLKDWDSQESVFGYDKAGRHAATWRGNGLNTRYDHDPAGRLQQIRHHERNKILARFQYALDKRGNRTQAFEQLANPATTTTIIDKANPAVTYDAGTWTDNGVYKQSNDFWARMKITFTGKEASLTMGRGNAHSIYDIYIDGSLWESFDGYVGTGDRVINIFLTTTGTHTLEVRNRPEKNSASTGYTVLFKQLAVLNTVYTEQTIKYIYDTLARLLDAQYYPGTDLTAPMTRRYQYAFDCSGNRNQQIVTIGAGAPTTTNYTYNNANQLTSGGATYDANGNLTSDGTNAYTWDKANRLLSMGGASHKYDGEGHRTQQTVGATVTKYLLDLQPGLSIVLSDTQGANVTRYIHAVRGIHAHKDASANWEYMAQDGLGSVRSVLDKNDSVLWNTNYDGYGNPFGAVGTSQTNYGFTGELLDGGGLLDVRARRYNPVLGILPSLDPFEGVRDRAMSLNGYSWVEGNVVNAGDPSGKIMALSGMCGIPPSVLRQLPLTDPCVNNCAMWSNNTDEFEECADDCERQAAFETVLTTNIKDASVTFGFIGPDTGCTTLEDARKDMQSKSGACVRKALAIGNITTSGILTHSHINTDTPSFENSMAAIREFKWLYIGGKNYSDVFPLSDVKFSSLHTYIISIELPFPVSAFGKTSSIGSYASLKKFDPVYFVYYAGGSSKDNFGWYDYFGGYPPQESLEVAKGYFYKREEVYGVNHFSLFPPVLTGFGDSGGGFYNQDGQLIGVLRGDGNVITDTYGGILSNLNYLTYVPLVHGIP